jgi:diguanylate cyclase (GGDEF)-like protein
MDQNEAPSPLHTAVSSLIAFAAGIGIWYVFSQATETRSLVMIPVAAGVIAAMLLLMLKESTRAGHETGSAAAQMDVYTRLPSHAVAHHFLQREFAAAERAGRDLTLVLFTLDNLPRYAATRGAGEANKILLSVGAIMRRHTRGMNMSSRLDGGYTFMSVLGSVDEAGAARFSEKVTRNLASVTLNGRPLDVRVGIYGYHPEMQSADELIARAYDALTEVSATDEDLMMA